jgi:hypothetical protein
MKLPPHVARVIRAWTDPGPMPILHHSARRALLRDWPALGRALDELAITELGARQPELAEAPGPLARLPHSVMWWPSRDYAHAPTTEGRPGRVAIHGGQPYVARLQLTYHTDGAPIIVYTIEMHQYVLEVVRAGGFGSTPEAAVRDALGLIARNWKQHAG